jgi:hypothetical protein
MNCILTEMHMKIRLFSDFTQCDAHVTGSEGAAACIVNRQHRGQARKRGTEAVGSSEILISLPINTKNIGLYISRLLIPPKTIDENRYCTSLLCLLDYRVVLKLTDHLCFPAAIWRVTDSHSVRRNSENTWYLLLLR